MNQPRPRDDLNTAMLNSQISPPDIGGSWLSIERPRLQAKVLPDIPGRLLLVSGAAGKGKTHLISHIAQRLPRAVLWVTFQPEDRQLTTACELILRAAQQKRFGVGERLQKFLLSPSASAGSPVLLAQLINEVLLEIEPVLLVLDDVHNFIHGAAGAAEPNQKFIEALAETLPGHARMILGSELALPVDLVNNWRSQSWLTEINEDELRFTVDEVSRLLSQAEINDPQHAVSACLEKLSDGWIALIKLFILKLGAGPSGLNAPRAAADPADLIAHFRQDALASLPVDVRDFIARSSICDELFPDELDEFLGRGDSGAILDGLARSNFFVIGTGARKQGYRFHDLLRQVAYRQLQQQYRQEEIQDMRLRLGRQLYAHGAVFDGARQMLLSGAAEEAAGCLLDQFGKADTQEDFSRVCRLIGELPDAIISQQPELARGRAAAAFFQGDSQAALRFVDQAIRGHIAANDYEQALLSYLNKIDYLRYFGGTEHLRQVCAEALELPVQPNHRHRLAAELIWLHNFGGPDRAARLREIASQSVELLVKEHDVPAAAMARWNLAGVLMTYFGHYREAKRLLDSALQALESHGWMLHVCGCLQSRGTCERELGQLDRSAEDFLRAAELARTFGNRLHELRSDAGLLICSTLQDAREPAAKAAERLRRALAEDVSVPEALTCSLALVRYCAACGEPAHAMTHVHRSIELARAVNSHETEAAARLLRGQISADLGHAEQADAELTACIRFCEQHGFVPLIGKALLIQAEQNLRLPSAAAKPALADALRYARNNELDALILSCRQYLPLICLAVAEGIERDYALRLIMQSDQAETMIELLAHADPRVRAGAALNLERLGKVDVAAERIAVLAADTQALAGATARGILRRNQLDRSQPFRVRSFGKFQLWLGAEQRLIPDDAWRLRRAKNLFIYLLLQRGLPVHQEVLAELFWPDADAAAGSHKLHVAVSSLRKTLEPELAPYQSSSYLICHDRHYSVHVPPGSDLDYCAFQASLDAVKAALRANDCDSAVQLFHQADQLAQGEFLEELRYEEWATEQRRNLANQFHTAGVKLAAQLLKQNQLPSSSDIATIVLARDPHSEEAVSIELQALIRSGNLPAARRAYGQFRDRLKRDLSCEPGVYLRQLMRPVMVDSV